MAQEIYHISNWGNPTEQWGNVYLNADLTNELYKRANEYENSWVTDQLLNGIGIKPSIILTPTAYENGVLNSVKPSDGSGDFNFNRGSISTRVNEQGIIEDVTETNLPRINYKNNDGSLLLEPQSTNLFLNSEILSTQDISTLNESHTVSFYGTGSITFSGTHTGTLTGTGINNRVTVTFTASSGTLTCTVSGSVKNAQIEKLSFATSYIPTIGSATTRLTDLCSNSGSSDLINSTEGVLYAEISALADDLTFRVLSLSDGTNNNTVKFGFRSDSNKIYAEVRSGAASQAFLSYDVSDITDFNKVALKYKVNDFSLFINGIERQTDVSGNVPIGLNTLNFNRGDINNKFYGNVKSVAVYKEALTDAELQKLTTI